MFGKKLLPLFLVSLMLLCFLASVNATINYSNPNPSNASYDISPNIDYWNITIKSTTKHFFNGTISLYYAIDNSSTGYSRILSWQTNGSHRINFTSGLYWGRDYIVYIRIKDSAWHNTSYTFSTKPNSGELSGIGISLLLWIILFIFGFVIILSVYHEKKISVKTVATVSICLVILVVIGAIITSII